MSKIDRFIAAVMGIPDVSKTSCSMCSCRSMRINSWSDCHSCIRDGLHIHFSLHDSLRKYISWSASSNGEISYPVRKWFQEHEPDITEQYLEDIAQTGVYHQQEYTKLLVAQLSFSRFAKYMIEHFDKWGWEECPAVNCSSAECKENPECAGSGRICKYPAAEKILREEP